MKIISLGIEGYRSLHGVTWIPGDLNVLVGSNGSGKSNLAQAVSHLASAAQGPEDFAEAMAQAGGILSVAWNGEAEAVRWLLHCDDGRSGLHSGFLYMLDVARIGATGIWEIAHEGITYRSDPKDGEVEFLSRKRENVRCPTGDKAPQTFTVPSDIPALAALSSALPSGDPVLCHTLQMRTWSLYRDIRTDKEATIREPSVITPETRLGPDCQNLTSVLYNLYREDRFREDLDRGMATAFHGYRGLDFPPTSDGRFHTVVKWKSLRGMSLSELSTGTLRYLCLLTLLASPDPPALLWIEDPEAGFHPGMLPIVAELAAAASARSQVVLSTHSAELLNYLSPYWPTVTVAKLKNGSTEIMNVDESELKRRLEKYTLGDLYRSGDLDSLV